ncbi:proteasome assembly chaperone family protein [Halocatena salina]|uniref:PAC2 family protein n=1 Tax=Halocatena salina TaxID=2934340 RepID=A0A8U0A5B7_9EURY|nr:PAC2 family protein [Halocatena salina]UPM44019.1 PAC2 family protein [Halocatena salina]
MATITIENEVDLEEPTCIEGLPGVGLVGKIAADHIIDTFDMTYHAAVQCSGLPPVAIYHDEDSELKPPVRLYADAERDLLVLHSEVPIAAESREAFANCVVGWLESNDVTPLFLSGLPKQGQGQTDDEEQRTKIGGEHSPELFGVATGDGTDHLDAAGIVPPKQSGAMSGPTGALLHEALDRGLTSVGLVVESNPQFPDPNASKALLDHGIAPITGLDIDTSPLTEQAEEIQTARQRLATQMQQAKTEESSQATPLRGFQ